MDGPSPSSSSSSTTTTNNTTTTTTTNDPPTIPHLPNLHEIHDRVTHATVLTAAQEPTRTPTLIYVSSAANPLCTRALPRVIDLAKRHPDVQVHVMELTAQTAPMIKFGPQNTPIFILVRGKWCETVLGADFVRIESLVKERLEV